MRNNGCPIDGIGFQCHENTPDATHILSTANTQAVDNAGFQWQVTELDCWTPSSNPDWSTQNSIYSQITNICTNDKNCRGLMTWGFTDKYTWLPTPNGLTFDTSYNKKTGYYAIDYMYANAPTLGPAGWSFKCNEWSSANFATPVDLAFGAGNTCYCRYGTSGNVAFNINSWNDPAVGQSKSGFFRDFTWCSPEWSSATVSLPVEAAFGANGSYDYKEGVSGTIYFDTSHFADKAPGVPKNGYFMSYWYCAAEGGTATFNYPVDLAYGANGQYKWKKNVTGTFTFNNSTFGGDPIPNVVKAGYYRPYHGR